MKKFFTLVCLLGLTISASAVETVNCILSIDTWPWNYTAAGTGKLTVNFTSQWGEFKLSSSTVDLTEYTGYEFVISEVADVQTKFVTSDQSADAGEGDYIELSVGTVSGNFSATSGTLTYFELQGKAAGASITVDEAYLVKADGTKEALVYGGSSWGCSYSAESYAITYTGQYGGVQIVNEDGSSIAFTHGEGTTYEFMVELEDAVAADVLMFEADASSGGVQWYNVTSKASWWNFNIFDTAAEDDGGVSVDIVKVYMKATSAETSAYPFTVTPKSIKYNIYTADEEVGTGISSVTASESATTSDAIYNLAGQRVSSSAKGLLIKNGKKYIVK